MNNYLKAKASLKAMEKKRADMLCKIKDTQTELTMLKDDMLGCGAEDAAVVKYNICKTRVGAFKDILESIDKVKLPEARQAVGIEKATIDSIARKYLNDLKLETVPKVQKLFEAAIKEMDDYSVDALEYSVAEGNPEIPRILRRIVLSDMSKAVHKRLTYQRNLNNVHRNT
jgi:hypothetical protein